MNCSRETVKLGTRLWDRAERSEREEDGCATGKPSRGTAGLDPRRTKTVRRRVQDPRTPGRAARSAVAVTPGREFMKYPG